MVSGEEIATGEKEGGGKGEEEGEVSTQYLLRGIVVHSGQASGGHYYSYVRFR